MKRWLGGAFLLAIGACGGKDSPTSPPVTTLAPAPPTVSSTNDGITGVSVAGQVAISGSTATVTATGYVTREQPAASIVWLWPQSIDYVQSVVYMSGSNPPVARDLRRWAPGSTLRLAFASGLERYDAMLQEHAAEMARWSRLGIVALPAGSANANVTLAVDPATVSEGAIATTSCLLSGFAYVSCRVSFLAEANITNANGRSNTLLHELGHVLGLGHSLDSGDVMSVAANRRSERSFGDPETRALTMMYAWRKAGNQFPDRERAGLASRGLTTEVSSCRW
jgi:hypothetical protein